MANSPDRTDDEGLPRVARALLDAVIAMSSDLDLHSVLDRIVVSACELTGARYGALGVIGADGLLSDFITHGVDETSHAAIGELPRGRGILGLLIDHPYPLRLEHLHDHPSSYGFPPHHPPMDSFLGVPVLIRGTVFGNLYLTEKAGGGSFTDGDESLVVALATAAGFVIENARAYAVSERQRAWLEASARLGDALQPPIQLRETFQQVAAGARAVSGARAVGVLVADPEGELALIARDGREGDELPALVERLHDLVAKAAAGETGTAQLSRTRTALALPLRSRLLGAPAAILVVTDDHHAVPGLAAKEQELIASFADQAALTLDRVQSLSDREELALVSDRERIARDLHDVVIQRLFATGLQLQSVQSKAVDPDVQARLRQAVADLDTTIGDIRTTIFELHQRVGASFKRDVGDLTREYTAVLGFAPTVRISGPLDSMVPPAVAEQALAVLREALSNVARHALAHSADVEITLDGDHLRLRVVDDGIGIPDERRESGLHNVRGRARDVGGEVRVHRVHARGTLLEWRVPLQIAGVGQPPHPSV